MKQWFTLFEFFFQTPLLEPFMLKFSSTMSSRVQVVSHVSFISNLFVNFVIIFRPLKTAHINGECNFTVNFCCVINIKILSNIQAQTLRKIYYLVFSFQSGQLQFLDIGGLMTPSSMYVYHVNTQGAMVMGFDMSSNGQASVFGDSSGNCR